MKNLYNKNQKLKVTGIVSLCLALFALVTFAILNEFGVLNAFRGAAIGVVFFFVAVAIIADRKEQKNKKKLHRLTSLTR